MSNPAEARPVSAWIRETAERLAATSETPRVDAEYLAAHCLGVERRALMARSHQSAPLPGLEALVQRRLQHEPIAYILGEWEFFGIPLEVAPPVLVPRPETEHLVETALAHLAREAIPAPRVLDVCTGSGCIALAIALHAPSAQVTATDIRPETLAVATRNVDRHQLAGRITLLPGDLFDALPGGATPFDAILSNPPYVAEAEYATLAPDIRNHEDPAALLAGPDGLDCYRRIVAGAPDRLAPGGLLALEIGDEQAAAVSALMRGAGFTAIAVQKDLAGHDRVVSGVRP